ncbi:MAG: insulinase family protein [Acidobacteria bacterium]|nr:insulinase family protein [Acidobacteriota bacterium]
MKEDIQETRLDNGLTILTDRMPGVRSATLGFFFRVGSRHEPRELNGISHFIEHTVFKGTARRSAFDIAIEQDRLGGNLDAFTTHEETGFAIKVIDDQLPRAFDLIADMLVNPRFDESDLESEQRVIIEEMKMIEDSPEEYLGEIFSEAFFGSDHPLGISIAGTPETVRSFGSEVTRNYHDKVFNATNLVIAAAGNVDHSQIVELAGMFSTQSTQRTQSKETSGISAISAASALNDPPQFLAPIVIKQRADLEQAHLVIATPFISATDDRRYAADLLANIIGGGTSSRLWQKVREERGLAYNVGASASMYQDCGVFSIFAGSSPEQTREIVDLSIAEMRAVVANGVTEDELDLAKQQSRASILLSLEDSASRAAALAQSEMVYGRQIAVEETLAKIDAVATRDIAAIAREFFTTENVAFAAIGDLEGDAITRDDLRL